MTLDRPTGPRELELIRDSGRRAFPPRLAEQPIFYPVLNEPVPGSGDGSRVYQEYWIPAEEREEFNRHLVGLIELIGEFHP